MMFELAFVYSSAVKNVILVYRKKQVLKKSLKIFFFIIIFLNQTLVLNLWSFSVKLDQINALILNASNKL